jgi:hypothetical protein
MIHETHFLNFSLRYASCQIHLVSRRACVGVKSLLETRFQNIMRQPSLSERRQAVLRCFSGVRLGLELFLLEWRCRLPAGRLQQRSHLSSSSLCFFSGLLVSVAPAVCTCLHPACGAQFPEAALEKMFEFLIKTELFLGCLLAL